MFRDDSVLTVLRCYLFFFFSSRRRHTRFDCDWSSDVCSSDLVRVGYQLGRGDPASARLAGWSAILLGAGFMTCTGLVFVTIPKQIARVFTPDQIGRASCRERV